MLTAENEGDEDRSKVVRKAIEKTLFLVKKLK
jgi:hypothetical protein